MTRDEMDNLREGDKIEVKSYSTAKGDYEWVPTTVYIAQACTNGGRFAHGGRCCVYAKVRGITECLTPELTRLAENS